MAQYIYNNFAIDYINKRIYHNPADPSASSDVYSVNQLYSWLQDVFDDLDQMDDYIPMTAQTPTAYTLVNGWFIDDDSTNYLDGGAITQENTNSDIVTLQLDADSLWNNFEEDDIGNTYTGNVSGASGNLLSYNNTTTKAWVRTTDTFIQHEELQGDSSAVGGGSIIQVYNGEDLFANVYTLGTLTDDPAPQVYIFQAGAAIAEWSSLSNWDRGHIDILVKVKEADNEIDNGNITVFSRQLGDLYDNFEIDLTAGGRNAVPVATATDLDNPSPSHYLVYESKTGALSPNEILTGATSGATAELRMSADDITAYATGAAGVVFLGGIKGTFVDTETITGGTSGETFDADGTIGDTFLIYDTEGTVPDDADLVADNTITASISLAVRELRGWYSAGGSGLLVADTIQTTTPLYGDDRIVRHIDFVDNDVLTGSAGLDVTLSAASQAGIASMSDITIAFVNGTAAYDGGTGTLDNYERLTWSGGSAIVLLDDTPGGAAGVLTLGNVIGEATIADGATTATGATSGAQVVWDGTLDSASHTMVKTFSGVTENYNYDVLVECGTLYSNVAHDGEGRNVTDVYEYMKYVCGEDSIFQMSTLVSTTITPLDGEEYIQAWTGYTPKKASPLGTFAGGTIFGAQGVFFEGMHSDDTQAVSIIDSDGEVRTPPNYQAITVSSIENFDTVSVFESTGNGSTDVKKTQYTCAFTASGSGTITINETIPTSTPTSGYIRIVDTSHDVEYRYAFSSWLTSTFTLDGVTTDAEITLNDTAYVPFIDKQVGAVTNVAETIIYTSDIFILIRVRQKGFLPFQTTGTYASTGSISGAIRTADGIVT